MINKNRFSIKNTKRVLHKVGKKWVVVSAVLLGLVAGGAAVTTQANAANTSVGVPAASAPATTGESQQEQQENTVAGNAINDLKSLHQKGYVNEALNGVNNRLRPKLNNTNAINGYNNLTSMAQANNLAKFSAGSGEPLGSANSANSSDNTWFGTLQEAENDVNAIHGNTASNSRYAKLLDIVNNVVNTTIPAFNYSINRNINPNTDLTSQQISDIKNTEIRKYTNQSYLQNQVKQGMLNKFNSYLKDGESIGAINVINNPSVVPSNVSLSNTPSIHVQLPSSVSIMGTTTIPETSISNIVNNGIRVIPSLSTSPFSATVQIDPFSATANYSLTADLKINSMKSFILNKLSSHNLNYSYNNSTKIYHITSKPNASYTMKSTDVLPNSNSEGSTVTVQNLQPSVHTPVTIEPLSTTEFNTSTIANIIDGTHYDTNLMMNMIESKAHDQINQRVLGFTNDQTKATNLEKLAADAIHAGDFMLDSNNTAMQANYNGIVNSLAGLKDDKTSAESNALNSIYSEASSLANSYDAMPDNSYDNSNDKTLFVSYLNRAANAASSAATSIKDNTAKLTADFTAMPIYIGKVNKYSATLSTDMHYGGKPATNNAQTSMNTYKTDVSNNDVNTINNASNAYASWADTDDAFNVTNANDASTDASNMASISGKAAKLVNVNFTAPISYVDGSRIISSSNVSSNLSNPSSAVTSVPTLKVTSMPTNYKLSSGANNTITLNGRAQSIQVVPISTSTNNKVIEHIDFNGDPAANTSMSGVSGSTGYVNAPANHHFTSGNASRASFTFTNSGTATFNVAANTHKTKHHNSHKHSSFNINTSTTNVAQPAKPSITPNIPTRKRNVVPKKPTAKANYVKVNKALQLHTNPNFTKRNRVIVIKPGTHFKIVKAVKAHNGAIRYEVKYNKKRYFITANKRWTSAFNKGNKHMSYVTNYGHYRYAKVGKALQLHTSPNFTKHNGVAVIKPGTELHIKRIVKSHGLVRYEVRYQGHNYFITANHNYSTNAYVQKSNFRKHGYKAVRVVKPLNEYRKASFAKRGLVRHFYRGSVLPVKRVITIASGEMTRLELTNGRYITANKNFVEPIR